MSKQTGAEKLYYSLETKMKEMSELLDKHNLSNLLIDDPKDKTFERLRIIWNDASGIAIAVKSLGEVAGVFSGEEEKVVIERKPFVETIAEARK